MTIVAKYYSPKKESFISLNDLMSKHLYIGFIPDDRFYHYMLITCGSAKGYAVNPNGTWTCIEQQKITKGTYIIFETKEELLEWMKG